ncbi:hypothetical protein ACFL3C_02350 [Patescibacteria group bacterium]
MRLNEQPRVRRKPGRKERMLAAVLAGIGAITGGVSTGCEPIVAAHGRYTTPDTYIRARNACSHLPRGRDGNYARENCETDIIDDAKEKR